MIRGLLLILSIAILLTACKQQNGAEDAPHLMVPRKTNQLTHTAPTRTPSLEALRMAHEEKLAQIEAQKAKVLKSLEMEQSKDIEALRARAKEIEAQKRLELAKEKERYALQLAKAKKEIKEIEARSAQAQAASQERIAKLEAKSRERVESLKGEYLAKITALEAKLKKHYLLIFSLLFLLALLTLIFLILHKRKTRIKEQEAQREHELQMLKRRQEHERIEKILEIVASNSTDKEVKVELIRLLAQASLNSQDPKLIEYKGNLPTDEDETTQDSDN